MSARPEGERRLNLKLTATQAEAWARDGDGDRAWFAKRPRRQFRLRKASRVERALNPGCTHMLIEQVAVGFRLRRPVLWTFPDIPDDDKTLARLAAGAVFAGTGGRA